MAERAFKAVVLGAALALIGSVPAVAATTTYIVPSEAMEPAFSVGERLTVDLDAYDAALPQIGDAIVFHPPKGAVGGRCGVRRRPGEACRMPTPRLSAQLFLKRVVALPGDRLRIRSGIPVVNGARVLTDLVQPCLSKILGCEMPRRITILPDHYFVLGDNTAASEDSRYWGPVPLRAILGKVIS